LEQEPTESNLAHRGLEAEAVPDQVLLLTASLLLAAEQVGCIKIMAEQEALVEEQADQVVRLTLVVRLLHLVKVIQAAGLAALLILAAAVVAQEQSVALEAELLMLVAMVVLAPPLLLVVLL